MLRQFFILEVRYSLNKQLFVQNVKMYCKLRGIKPTIACTESGAGKSLLSQIETRGSIPSVEKVQLLAQYLKVSTSELLGEELPGDAPSPMPDHWVKFSSLSPADQDEIIAMIEYKSNKNRGGKYK